MDCNIGDLTMICTCGKELKSENDLNRGHCFACHVRSVGFTFKAASEGRSNFNGPTIREIQKSYEDTPEFKSGKISKVPARAELI
jgi:hypothetical protein